MQLGLLYSNLDKLMMKNALPRIPSLRPFWCVWEIFSWCLIAVRRQTRRQIWALGWSICCACRAWYFVLVLASGFLIFKFYCISISVLAKDVSYKPWSKHIVHSQKSKQSLLFFILASPSLLSFFLLFIFLSYNTF